MVERSVEEEGRSYCLEEKECLRREEELLIGGKECGRGVEEIQLGRKG